MSMHVTAGRLLVRMARYNLTVREAEVALLAAVGASSEQIADAIYVTPRTAKQILRRVYHKVGLSPVPQGLGRIQLLRVLLGYTPTADAQRRNGAGD